MATPRRPTRPASDPVGQPTDFDVTPSAIGATGANFESFIWQQLGDIQKSLGTIMANQTSTDDRMKSVEGKVGTLNRIVWIGVGIFGVIAVLAGIVNPLVHFLIRVGLVTAQ
jgi:hypothetical protein